MKKHLIIVFAICVLFLSACGSLVETSTSTTHSTAHATGSITAANMQSVCQSLHDQQAQLSQQYQPASIQLSAAQARGNMQTSKRSKKELISLRQSLGQKQAQLKLCYKNVG